MIRSLRYMATALFIVVAVVGLFPFVALESIGAMTICRPGEEHPPLFKWILETAWRIGGADGVARR